MPFLGAADSRHYQLINSLDQTQSAYRKQKSVLHQKYQFDSLLSSLYIIQSRPELIVDVDPRALDMIGWVILGSLLTLVTALGLSTAYYRRRAHRAEHKTPSDPAPLDSVFSHSKSVYKDAGGSERRSDNQKKNNKNRNPRKYKYRPASHSRAEENFSEFPDYMMAAGVGAEPTEEDHQYFPGEDGACGDRYDRHGVKIEENIDNFI